MKKIIVLLILSLVVITGCKKKEKIVGRWIHDSYVYTFNEDKTCIYEASTIRKECTYEVDGENLLIPFNGNTAPNQLKFEIKGKKLIIKDLDEKQTEYEKK